MGQFGFITDSLEIKLLILYIASRLAGPAPFEVLQDLSMCDDGVDYFGFSECLADLVRTEHLAMTEDGLYTITEKGLKNSQICETSLPYSVRLRCDKNLAACNRKLRRKSQVRAASVRRENGTFTVNLSLDDDMGSILDLNLMVPHGGMAKEITDRFRKAPERMYNQLMELLLSDGQDDKSEK